ncbi:MAG: shikimate kinase [Bacteroidales bacterium]|jgi:shikimate kinase|nr:shikimate kinase [Bacteroidales bacterium]
MRSERIFIIGFMFSGKSVHGNNLARAMDRLFVDTDNLLSEREGLSIPEMFEKHGQKWFRKKEKELLRSFLSVDNVVISTGGGTPIYSDNMDWMLSNGTVLYLKMNATDVIERVKNADNVNSRPLLSSIKPENIEREIIEMLSQRTPIYERAHITVSGTSFNAVTVKQAILATWSTHPIL